MLHMTAKQGLHTVFRFLLSHGADRDKRTTEGLTVEQLATPSVQKVLQGKEGGGRGRGRGRDSSIHLHITHPLACARCSAFSLPEEKAEEKTKCSPSVHSQILEAAKEGSLEVLQQLVTPESVNCQDMEGRKSTPLHFAAGYNRKEIVEFLLEQKADVGKKDKG